MAKRLRFDPAIIGVLFLVISSATFVFAQADLTKALVGTWEGWVEGSS